MNFTEDAVIGLFAAVVRKWIEDARDDPAELVAVADFLDMSPAQVLARKLQPLSGRLLELTGFRSGLWCPACGREIRTLSEVSRGRPKQFCSKACGQRYRHNGHG